MTDVCGEPRKIYFAVNLLGYSRHFHVRAVVTKDSEHTYESLVRSFEYFGGVPAEVWVDNLEGGRDQAQTGAGAFQRSFQGPGAPLGRAARSAPDQGHGGGMVRAPPERVGEPSAAGPQSSTLTAVSD